MTNVFRIIGFMEKCVVCNKDIFNFDLNDPDEQDETMKIPDSLLDILIKMSTLAYGEYFIKKDGITVLQCGDLCKDCYAKPLEERIKRE